MGACDAPESALSTGIERPIELAPEVHRRFLLGRKSDTLRLPMRPQPALTDAQWERIAGRLIEYGYLYDHGMRGPHMLDAAMHEGLLADLRCPWGRGGDLLWCREPWAVGRGGYLYQARDAARSLGVVWRPAHCMPRAAARLVLKMEHVGIGEDEAQAYVWEIDVVRVCGA